MGFRPVAVCAFVAIATFAAACGGVNYAVQVTSASQRFSEARALGAEQYATYEYYYAKEHLDQAQVEAAEANYSDAALYAEIAEESANRAIEISRAARGVRAGQP